MVIWIIKTFLYSSVCSCHSLWRVLTKHGSLEKGMANHSSILASRIPWTVWKVTQLFTWKLIFNLFSKIFSQKNKFATGRMSIQKMVITFYSKDTSFQSPGKYTFTSITSHINDWAVFLLWLSLFILSGAISPPFSSSILGTYRPGEFIFQCHIFLPFF